MNRAIGGQSGGSFTWTVPTDLEAAQYAIEIQDDTGGINYSVQFPISGESGNQTTGSADEPATTNANVATSSTLADVSPTPTPTTETGVESMSSEDLEIFSKTEAPESSAGEYYQDCTSSPSPTF